MDSSNDWMKYAGAGALGGAGLSSLFGGGKNPYDAASKYYDQIPGNLQQSYNPYIQEGQGLGLKNFYQKLMNDPGSFLANLGKGYQKSPGYDFERTEGLNGINNAAAAGGMLGTNQHQEEAGNLATNLANKDYGSYLDRSEGLFGKGLGGLEHLFNTGYDASKSLAENLSQALMSQGNLSFSGAAAENQKKSSGWGDLFGGAASLASLFGG
jgi:hypothetical protein